MTVGRIPSVEGGIQPTIVDAKGDIIAATAADTVTRLAVGANDTVLVADSAQATGLKWATPASVKVLQIQTGAFTSTATTTSTSFVDTGITVSITPSSASNEILLFVSVAYSVDGTGNGGMVTLTDGSDNNLINAASPGSRTPAFIRVEPDAINKFIMNGYSLVLKHSPATTSSFTYKIRHRVTGAGATSQINRIENDTNAAAYTRGVSTIIAMEVTP